MLDLFAYITILIFSMSIIVADNNGHNANNGQKKNTRKTYLDLLNNLKFDELDPILGSNHGELSCIFY